MANVTMKNLNRKDFLDIMKEVDMEEDSPELEMMQKESEKYAEMIVDVVLAEDLSAMALTDSGVAAGAVSGIDFTTEMKPEFKEYMKNHPLFCEMDKIQERCCDDYAKHQGIERKSFPKGHTVIMMACGSNFAHRNQGIEAKLHSHALAQYKQKGYKYVMAMTHNPLTEKQYQEFGYKSITKYDMPASLGEGKVELLMKEL